MTTAAAYASVNDQETSWSDIGITMAVPGAPDIGDLDIANIKWGRKVELGERRGPSGGRVMARTTGVGSQTASMSIYRSSLKRLLAALAAVAPQRGNQRIISKVSFDILVQHTPIGSDLIFTTRIKGCRYTEDADDMKEGSDADQIEITLNPIEVANVMDDGTEVVLL